MTTLTVANLKGGVGKTTSSVLLSLGLAETGRTLLVDADPIQSALKWAETAEDAWPWDRLTVVSWTDHRALERQIAAVRRDYDHLVIDVPPRQDKNSRGGLAAATLEAALMATGHLIVPTSTSGIDLAEIGDTFRVAAAVDKQREVLASVLFVRVWLSTKSATVAREVLADDFGYPVMRTVIPVREDIAQSYGTVPTLTGPFIGYADALAEIRADHDDQEA